MYSEVIEKIVMEKIGDLSWKCDGCKYVSECEADKGNESSRFCEPLIRAALLNQDTFEWPDQCEKTAD